MKTFITILLIANVAAILAAPFDELKAKMMETKKQCIAETGVPEDILAKIKKHEPITSREGKCFKACLMEKAGVLTPDFKLSKDKFLGFAQALIGDDQAKLDNVGRILDECNSHSETDKCEAANAICNCVFKSKQSEDFQSIL